MDEEVLIEELATVGEGKIVLLVIDGLGGLPHPRTGMTELETARTPAMDRLASSSTCGLIHPILPGITPGSGPAHLALFGYDPLEYDIGRGVLSALGIGMELKPDDVAARVNFCTVENGVVTDRRAGRISTEKNAQLCSLIEKNVKVDGLEYELKPEKEHRAALVLKGKGLSSRLTDSDPQRTGLPPLTVHPEDPHDQEALSTAERVNLFIRKVAELLADHHPANMILTRGFSKYPSLRSMRERYKIKPAAIATYPMYKGLAKLVGMAILPTGDSFEEQVDALESNWRDHDFFYIHYKKTDSKGEDGDFEGKVQAIEEVDASLERILGLEPEIMVVTGDHSTPAVLRSHSWHPNPLILSSRYECPDEVKSFSERECRRGGLGIFNAKYLMSILMANAKKLEKYGA